jgi:hypothetical protein
MKGFKKYRDELAADDWGTRDVQEERNKEKRSDKRAKRKFRFEEKHQNT